jgi:hypothetical protein
MLTPKLRRLLLPTIATVITQITACGGMAPHKDPNAERELATIGTAYGIVVGVESADYPANIKACHTDPGTGRSAETCGRLDEYNVVTVNVAATTGRSFLKFLPLAPKSVDLKKGDIIKFSVGRPSEFQQLASRGEREACKWTGDPPIMMGFPGQEGGIECDGWSYKKIMHINWAPKTWLPF